MDSRRPNVELHGLELRVGGHVVGQPPNPPILIAAIGLLASWLLSEGSTAWQIARAAFYVGFAIWAFLELTSGVNLFRRALGAGALAWIALDLGGVF